MSDSREGSFSVISGFLEILAGIGLLVWHCFRYLQEGVFSVLSFIDMGRWLGLSWAHSPQSWLGLHEVLTYLPVFVILLLHGLWLFFYGPTD